MVYSLTVEIPLNQLEWLFDNKYTICIAKKTSEDYNIIWQRLPCAENVIYEWRNNYGVFWTQKIDRGTMHVEEGSKTIPITFGLNTTIQRDGIKGLVTGAPDKSGRFSVTNKSKLPLNIGLSTRNDGKWKPCYVSQQQVITSGTIEIIPQNRVEVWFQMDSPTIPGIGGVRSNPIELEYLKEGGQRITYKGDVPGGGEWVTLK